MNRERISRVIENMKGCGLEQILVSATPSVYYLTGRWIAPGERMLALYLNADGDVVLFANRLFAQAPEAGMELVEFDDTEDPIALLAARVRPGRLGVDKVWPSQFIIRLMEAEEELNRQIDQLVDTKIEIGKLIEMVHNESYRLLLEKRYLCFLAWDQIAAEMHYSRRWVLNKHERALEVADKLLREKEGRV